MRKLTLCAPRKRSAAGVASKCSAMEQSRHVPSPGVGQVRQSVAAAAAIRTSSQWYNNGGYSQCISQRRQEWMQVATAGIGAPAGLTAALDIYKPEGGRRSHPCRMLVDEIAMAEIVRALSVHQHLRRGQHPDSALGPLRGVGHVVDKARRGVQIELPWAADACRALGVRAAQRHSQHRPGS